MLAPASAALAATNPTSTPPVYKSAKCRGFVGFGDAHPGNVSPLIFNHAEMRMAETRAVNRALRKAYGVALFSLKVFPTRPLSPEQVPALRHIPVPAAISEPEFWMRPAPVQHALENWSALFRAWADKNLQKIPICNVYYKYRTR